MRMSRKKLQSVLFDTVIIMTFTNGWALSFIFAEYQNYIWTGTTAFMLFAIWLDNYFEGKYNP